MFESGFYKSLPEHVALFEALEASMERANRDEFLAENDKSRKRCRKDQDPPPPPSHSDPILEDDKPATPELDWVIPPNELSKPKNNWANFCQRIGKKKLSKTDLEGLTFKVVRPFRDNNISLQFQIEGCYRMLTDQVDLVNPEGHRIVPDVRKPLPLEGPPELVSSLWIKSEREYDISAAYDISHWWFKHKELYITRHDAPLTAVKSDHNCEFSVSSVSRLIEKNDQKNMMRETEVHKFSDGMLNMILEKLDHMVKDFRLFKYNPGMTTRIWSEDDKRRSKEFMGVIEHRLKL
nr:hypothetical protein [Tanacetum cinerariifolium]